MSLLNKYAVILGDDLYRKVQVTSKISEEVYLVTDLEPTYGDAFISTLFHLGMMLTAVHEDGSYDQTWFFFDTLEELNAWIKDLDAPRETANNEQTVVNFPTKFRENS